MERALIPMLLNLTRHCPAITGGHHVSGLINGNRITLLLHTGVAVTFAIATQPSDLKPWTGATLVSAGGTPVCVYGCTCFNLELVGEGEKISSQFCCGKSPHLRSHWGLTSCRLKKL